MELVWQELSLGIGDWPHLARTTVRLIVAALLGAVIGYEREKAGKAAGLRTHVTVALGAAPEGPCLRVHIHAQHVWRGALIFDTPRHRQHVSLALDYPRLNQWPEWWTAEPTGRYAITLPDGTGVGVDGATLAAGLPLAVAPNVAHQLLVCPA